MYVFAICCLKQNRKLLIIIFQELDSKRMRALKRAQDERELAAMKDKEIEKLQGEIDDLKQKKEELLARIGKYSNHNKYLEKVCLYMLRSFSILFHLQTVEAADEFQEIRELIDRYTTLKTNKEVTTLIIFFS